MIQLESSLHQFNPNHFGGLDDFLSTADNHQRDTLMIACADHGTSPDNVSFAGPERFFILQHLAASIPPPRGSEYDNLIGDVQYAFHSYDIKQIVLCGHLGCGVIPNWLTRTDTRDKFGLRTRFHSETVKAVKNAYPGLTKREYIERLICEHALCQLENLQAYPFVRRKLDADQVKLHLWIVNDETARVLSFDPRRGALVRIEDLR